MRCPIFYAVALVWASGLWASSGGISPFEVAFAEGAWAFSQRDSVSAVEHFKEALRLRPGHGFTLYLLGLSHLRLGEAEEAEQKIAASLAAKPPPPVKESRILVDLGAAHLAAGDADAAIRRLEEALKDWEGDAVALHHYATALAIVGRREEAEAARGRARALDSTLDPENLPIDTPRVAAEDPRWSGALSLTADHDSNPNLLSEDLSLPVPSPKNAVASGNSSDWSAGADLQASYGPVHLPADWNLALALRGGGTLHQDFDYLDIARAGGTVQLTRGLGNRWSLLLQTGGEEILLDGSAYLRMLDARGLVRFSPTPADTTRLDLLFLDRSYSDHPLADPDREGEEVRIGLRQIRYFGGQDRYVSLGIATADRSAGAEFERTLWEGEIQAALPVGPRWQLGLAGRFTEEDFGNRASNFFNPEQGPARHDRTWGASATLSYSFTDSIQAQVRGSYTDRSSDVDMGEGLPDLDYRRSVLGSGVVWSF